MLCIYCSSPTKITNSRSHKKHPTVWRRHTCTKCMQLFSTYEQPDLSDEKVRDTKCPDASFSFGKLLISIFRASEHVVDSPEQASYHLAQTVVLQLLGRMQAEQSPLSTKLIATTTHTVLKQYNPVAGLQYAARHQLISSVRQRGRPSIKHM